MRVKTRWRTTAISLKVEQRRRKQFSTVVTDGRRGRFGTLLQSVGTFQRGWKVKIWKLKTSDSLVDASHIWRGPPPHSSAAFAGLFRSTEDVNHSHTKYTKPKNLSLFSPPLKKQPWFRRKCLTHRRSGHPTTQSSLSIVTGIILCFYMFRQGRLHTVKCVRVSKRGSSLWFYCFQLVWMPWKRGFSLMSSVI